MSTFSLRPGKSSMVIPVVIVALVLLVVFLDARRRSAENRLQELSVQMGQVQGGDAQQNREKAQAIVAEVSELMKVETTPEPTVATIVDVEKLRQSNPFYNKAENGDYLIVTQTRAILYSQKEKKILDVVPVQIDQTPTAQQSSSAKSVAAAKKPAATTATSSAQSSL